MCDRLFILYEQTATYGWLRLRVTGVNQLRLSSLVPDIGALFPALIQVGVGFYTSQNEGMDGVNVVSV